MSAKSDTSSPLIVPNTVLTREVVLGLVGPSFLGPTKPVRANFCSITREGEVRLYANGQPNFDDSCVYIGK